MPEQLSLINALTKYIEQCQLEEQSPRTVEGKLSCLRIFVRWYIANRGFFVSDLSLDGINDYIKHLHVYRCGKTQKLITKATRRNKITRLRMFCLYLFKTDLIDINFSEKVTTPSADKLITQEVLQPDEMNAVINQTSFRGDKGLRDSAILAILAACGTRRGDITQILTNGINTKANLILIPRGKGGKGRIVPIADKAMDVVVYYRDKVRPKLQGMYSGDILFLDDKGMPFRGSQVTRLVNRYKHRAGVIKPGASNLFRHTAATNLMNNGADIITVKCLLGHASVVTTEGYISLAVQKYSGDYQDCHPAVKHPEIYIPSAHPVNRQV
ncbi:tyrosine-type recombinase/integrase [Alteromonas lipotrueae]|uniref:tyrosine-type recombinase/integrase n=1 Tax=Alteromonas lipotrueae TaxID=2803814 RepID=UPI001C471DCD